jgi:hypothetical protein
MKRRTLLINAAAAAALVGAASLGIGQEKQKPGFKDTPMLPGGKWHVHDSDRPHPPNITPATPSTQEKAGTAPSDAVVLFDGKDLSHWKNERGGEPAWKVVDGAIVAQRGGGTLVSKDEFGDCQIHIEWASPNPPRGRDQDRGNSGVLISGRYEVQVLDSFDNLTYADGQASAIYGQYPPLVNASRKPGEWQTYDIAFTAPRFKSDGSLDTPAYETVFHNGVLVHNHTAVIGAMSYRTVGKYTAHKPEGPLALQDHGHPVKFRNIWVRPIKAYDEP